MIISLAILGLGAFYADHWRQLTELPSLAHTRVARHGGHWVEVGQTSAWFTKALVASEDQSFWTNWGVSFEGTARALVVDVEAGRFAQGGSTITQQLIRDLLLTPKKTLSRKLTGSLLSLMASRMYTKSQILTMYINEVYLGAGSYGIDAAAYRYFGINPSQLTLPEASLLAGLPMAPSLLNPLKHLAAAKARQREVLDSMVSVHLLTATQAQAAWQAPLPLKASPAAAKG